MRVNTQVHLASTRRLDCCNHKKKVEGGVQPRLKQAKTTQSREHEMLNPDGPTCTVVNLGYNLGSPRSCKGCKNHDSVEIVKGQVNSKQITSQNKRIVHKKLKASWIMITCSDCMLDSRESRTEMSVNTMVMWGCKIARQKIKQSNITLNKKNQSNI